MVTLLKRPAPAVATTPDLSQPSTSIIDARGVIKTYATGNVTVPALRGVDLSVAPGEMVAIMGPSGCGKTTLLNCLSGLDEVDQGEILISGTDLSKLSDNARTDFRARQMGFIFQFYNLLPVLSAVENVELPLLVSGVRTRQARERALVVLEQVGLAEWAQHRPAELSGGQRQRVTIARALVNQPAIVWGDEPTGDLDSQNADEIMALMRELNLRNGQTFVLVTHDPRIGELCDRIVRMKDGTVVSYDDASLPESIEPTATGSINGSAWSR
jgi:putative ABC transport system ATP-binding protein